MSDVLNAVKKPRLINFDGFLFGSYRLGLETQPFYKCAVCF